MTHNGGPPAVETTTEDLWNPGDPRRASFPKPSSVFGRHGRRTLEARRVDASSHSGSTEVRATTWSRVVRRHSADRRHRARWVTRIRHGRDLRSCVQGPRTTATTATRQWPRTPVLRCSGECVHAQTTSATRARRSSAVSDPAGVHTDDLAADASTPPAATNRKISIDRRIKPSGSVAICTRATASAEPPGSRRCRTADVPCRCVPLGSTR